MIDLGALIHALCNRHATHFLKVIAATAIEVEVIAPSCCELLSAALALQQRGRLAQFIQHFLHASGLNRQGRGYMARHGICQIAQEVAKASFSAL
eukprot:CAMPEP_0180461430 /NCGR_PEP_ID=MMETSP1036_2-20121128/23875_1 /TAXON_ID=632150 /ORGANISM="Azadinium spinosum, Strain 3D9" /LENGTH=94 /DNA_ID=CAMNT_0022468151 /DNA_START=112 /DNA_END=396 /DNA_ORIENTATION=+